MIDQEQRQTLMTYRIQQAKEMISDVDLLLQHNSLRSAVNRIYYGMFYMLLALGLKYGFDTSKHQQLLGAKMRQPILRSIALTVLAAWSITFCVAAEVVKLTPDIELQRLTETVWLHTTYVDYPGYGRTPANGLIVIDGATAAMIDTPWNNEQTGKLFEWVTQQHAAITHVIVGHSHEDCMGGLAEAHRRGAASYGLALTAEKALDDGNPAPQTTFTDTFTIKLETMELVLYYFGGGHTVDNIVTYLPAQKLLFGGCLIKARNSNNLGNLAEADVQSWPGTVQKVIDAFPEVVIVVPGHGAVGGKELLLHTKTLAETFRQ